MRTPWLLSMVVVLVIGVGLLAGNNIRPGSGEVPFSSSVEFRGDQVPKLWDSGQPFEYAHAGGPPIVSDGLMDAAPGERKVYLESTLGRPVVRMGAEFEFDDRGGSLTTDGAVLAVVTWNDGGVIANGLGRRTRSHIYVGRHHAGYQIRSTTGGPLELIGRYEFSEPLKLGVRYTIRAELSGDTASISMPDGRNWWISHPAIDSDDTFACFEPFYPDVDTDIRVRTAKVWFEAGDK